MDRHAILRVSVPVDDAWHTVQLRGPILHVAARRADEVDVWFFNIPGRNLVPREFTVVGTGHPVSGDYVGTAIVPGGALVWHLIERVTSVIDGETSSPAAIEGARGR